MDNENKVPFIKIRNLAKWMDESKMRAEFTDYESPITMYINHVTNQVIEERDNAVVGMVSEQIGLNIDKEELLKALQYDRDQFEAGYRKGYFAGHVDNYPHGLWHPIKTRPLTEEEKAELRENPNVDEDIVEAKYDCALPEDGQEVLITTKAWNKLAITTFHFDVDGCYFEDWEDVDEVAAWMPLPKPYGGETND